MQIPDRESLGCCAAVPVLPMWLLLPEAESPCTGSVWSRPLMIFWLLLWPRLLFHLSDNLAWLIRFMPMNCTVCRCTMALLIIDFQFYRFYTWDQELCLAQHVLLGLSKHGAWCYKGSGPVLTYFMSPELMSHHLCEIGAIICVPQQWECKNMHPSYTVCGYYQTVYVHMLHHIWYVMAVI